MVLRFLEYQKLFITFILFCGIFCVLCSPISASNPIQDAIDNADPGDTVSIDPGTYEGEVNVNKDCLTLKANGEVIIKADDQSYGFKVTKPGNTVQGFKINNVKGNAIIVISNQCKILKNYVGNTDGDAILVKGNQNLIQENTVTQTNNGAGMIVEGDNNLIISNQVTHSNPGFGIVGIGNNLIISRNTINDISNDGNANGIGIHSENTGGTNKIYDNQINACDFIGIDVSCKDGACRINNNQVTNTAYKSNSKLGIKLTSSSIVTSAENSSCTIIIENNKLDKSGTEEMLSNGIRIEGDGKNIIRNNRITNIGGISILMIHIDDSAEIQIIKNTMNSRNGGIGFEDGGGKYLLIKENILTHTGTTGIGLNSNTINNVIITANSINKSTGAAIYCFQQPNMNITVNNNKIYNTLRDGEDSVGMDIRIDEKGSVNISGNTILNNQGTGLSIETNGARVSIINNVLKGNSGGGVSLDIQKGSNNITRNTIINPYAKNKSGILILNGDAKLNYNYILYPIRIQNKGKGHINALLNWWGSNQPDFRKIMQGQINSSAWLYMTFIATPASILYGRTSKLTTSFNNISTGTKISPLNPDKGHIPDNTVINFNTSRGSLTSPSTLKKTFNGMASAYLTGTQLGVAKVTAETLNYVLSAKVTIKSI